MQKWERLLHTIWTQNGKKVEHEVGEIRLRAQRTCWFCLWLGRLLPQVASARRMVRNERASVITINRPAARIRHNDCHQCHPHGATVSRLPGDIRT